MNKWLDGVMGVVVGDALGSPVQFHRRGEVTVRKMERCDTFDTPPGTWTDDTSLTLASVESIKRRGKIDLEDMANNFVEWLFHGEFTPFGQAFDVGGACMTSIDTYAKDRNTETCGQRDEGSNGNGSLMRILPTCLAADSVEIVEKSSALTHAHRRSQVGCGLYYFMVGEILNGDGNLRQRLNNGLTKGYENYKAEEEFKHYSRLYNDGFFDLPMNEIKSSGYVVHTLEAAVWCLGNTRTIKDALLMAANLGDDADTVAALCGGLAGLYYGYDAIPEEWLKEIKRREWIEELLTGMA